MLLEGGGGRLVELSPEVTLHHLGRRRLGAALHDSLVRRCRSGTGRDSRSSRRRARRRARTFLCRTASGRSPIRSPASAGLAVDERQEEDEPVGGAEGLEDPPHEETALSLLEVVLDVDRRGSVDVQRLAPRSLGAPVLEDEVLRRSADVAGEGRRIVEASLRTDFRTARIVSWAMSRAASGSRVRTRAIVKALSWKRRASSSSAVASPRRIRSGAPGSPQAPLDRARSLSVRCPDRGYASARRVRGACPFGLSQIRPSRHLHPENRGKGRQVGGGRSPLRRPPGRATRSRRLEEAPMSRTAKTLMSIGLSLGLVLAAALEGAPRPSRRRPRPLARRVRSFTSSRRPTSAVARSFGSCRRTAPTKPSSSRVPGGESYSPVWTPDGEWISVASNRGDGVWRLWLVRRDGEVHRAGGLARTGARVQLLLRVETRSSHGNHPYVLARLLDLRGERSHGLWAVKVDLGENPPRILPDPVCLTRDESLIASSWHWPAWTGDGTHLSAYEFVREDEPRNYKVFDFVDDPADSAGPRLANPKVLFTGPLTYGLRFEWRIPEILSSSHSTQETRGPSWRGSMSITTARRWPRPPVSDVSGGWRRRRLELHGGTLVAGRPAAPLLRPDARSYGALRLVVRLRHRRSDAHRRLELQTEPE